jgi:hypothetical protein
MGRGAAFQASIQAFLVPQGFINTMRGTFDNLPRNASGIIIPVRLGVNWGFVTHRPQRRPKITNTHRKTLHIEFTDGNEQRPRAPGKAYF